MLMMLMLMMSAQTATGGARNKLQNTACAACNCIHTNSLAAAADTDSAQKCE
jgi:hypothetical protein